MRFIKEKLKNFDNRGLTLVELVCSVAILGIIAMIVGSVLVVSADSYNRGSSEIQAQQEAQLVANQIDDLLIDATAEVKYEDETLTIKQGGVTHTVTFEGDELYYSDGTTKQLMASGVADFNVDDSEFAERGYLKLNMNLNRKSQTYESVFTITARNKDTTEATKVIAAIHLPNELVLEPNQSYDLTATTSGLTNQSLSWSVVGSSDSSNTYVTPGSSSLTAKVHVGSGEMSRFKVKVTSTDLGANGAPMAQKIIDVYVRRVNQIDIAGNRVSGDDCKAGAQYSLTATVLGPSHAKINGADYDVDYIDPGQASWSVIEGAAYASVSATGSMAATVTLTADIPEGSQVVVQATALHPNGAQNAAGEWTNKASAKAGSTVSYATVTNTYTIKKSHRHVPAEPEGGGWKRQSSDAQGPIDDLTALKVANNSTKHVVLYRYREDPNGSWETHSDYNGKNINGEMISGAWGTWELNRYGDANNSQTVNLRPLLTGLLDYRKDYWVEAVVVIMDENDNVVYPPYDDPAEVDLFTMSGRMNRVGLTYRSDSNMMNLQNASQNSEATAPTITAFQHQQFVLMEMQNIVGIDTVGTSVDNDINYILEKKQPDGTWKDVTNKDQYEVQKGRACRVTLRNNDYKGSYRVKVYIQNMPNNYWNEATNSIIPGNPARIDYILYDEESGNNIFYFNVM
ncbi:MAG: type II secretion system GspH family protein [Lachnoclostridium sp.]|nr:type II secretion system GspH family protein [Lachnospira sp.]MCM1246809.1 type II secretion system GspH family protein [Lachnoclostridium sp.]MCM1535404.1 type II secretion system GspH family protein [Clostridium sp.]